MCSSDLAVMQTALLAENAEAGAVEDGDGRGIGGDVAVVLTGVRRSRAGGSPVVECVEGAPHRSRCGAQHLEQLLVGHSRRP